MNISKILEKSKGLISSDLYIVAIIVFIAFAGFGLGRLSVVEENRMPVKIEYPKNLSASVLNSQDTANNASNSTAITGGLLVASKNGSKYHFPWCSGAKRIKDSNKIWFDSAEDAKKAGYSPAANCKGL